MIDPSIFDLFVLVGDGLDVVVPPQCRPSAAWAIDTYMDQSRCMQRFGDADFLFAAGRTKRTHSSKYWCDP